MSPNEPLHSVLYHNILSGLLPSAAMCCTVQGHWVSYMILPLHHLYIVPVFVFVSGKCHPHLCGNAKSGPKAVTNQELCFHLCGGL
jgi:hypothetical protein